jgi:Ceramidase
MDQYVFRYCERGDSISLLAEPLNALSNVAYIVAALLVSIALGRVMQTRKIATGDFAVIAALIGAATATALGSIAFHVLATRFSQMADVIPIGIFMLLYLAFALRVLLGASLGMSALGIAAFVATSAMLSQLPCQPIGISVTAARLLPSWCLNGGLSYLPALAALVAVAVTLSLRRHPSARHVLCAAALFGLALALRSIDLATCPLFQAGLRALTAHALWHVATAGVIYLLLIAAISAVESRSSAL